MKRHRFGIAALCIGLTLAGCQQLFNPLVGKTYVNVDRDGSYEFVSRNEAEFSHSPSESLVSCNLQKIGVTYLTSSADLTNYDHFYVTRSSSGYLSYFAVKANAKISVNSSGEISAQEGSATSAEDIAYLTPNNPGAQLSQRQFAELVHSCNESSFFGAASDAAGNRLEAGEALARMEESSSSDDSGFGAVSFSATHVLNANQERVVATVPYSVDSSTVSLDWKEARFDYGSISVEPKLKEYFDRLFIHELVVFRIEDDAKFLFNPETERRFKQE